MHRANNAFWIVPAAFRPVRSSARVSGGRVAWLAFAAVAGPIAALAQAPPGGARPPVPMVRPDPSAPGATAVVRNEGEDYAGPALPKGYRPPRVPPEVMTLEKPLLGKEEEREIQRELTIGRFNTLLRGGEWPIRDAKTRDLLRKGARYSVHRLSMKEYRDDVHDMRDKVVRETNDAALVASRSTDGYQAARPFRDFYLKEVTDRAAELLDGNFQVRLNAVILLSELTIKGDASKNIPDEAFTPALDPLVKVLEDKDQPEAVKIHAVRGLSRILSAGKPKVDDRLRIGLALSSELRRTDTHFWYQMRLAEAMGWLDAVIDRNRKPYAAQTLMEVVVDKGRHCMPRSEAARSLGRIPLDGDVNVALVAFEVVHLAEQLSEGFNNDPAGIYWRDAYFRIYLAFKPRDKEGIDRGDGLLTKVDKPAYSKHKATVTEAYAAALPLVKHVVSSTEPAAFPEGTLSAVVEWLKKKQPSDYRVAPNLDPITAQDGGSQPAAAALKPAG